MSKEKEAALSRPRNRQLAEAARREGKKQLEEARQREKENQKLNGDHEKVNLEAEHYRPDGTVESQGGREEGPGRPQLKLDQLSKEKDAAVLESARLKTARDGLEKKLGETKTALTKAQARAKESEAKTV